MRISHEKEKNLFIALDEDDKKMGEIGYMPDSDTLTATHTEVYPEYQGKGLAGKLLDALADFAADEGKKIVPKCSYVVSAFKKNPEKYKEVL